VDSSVHDRRSGFGDEMEFIFSTGALPGYPITRCFEVARAAGADGVELLLTPRLRDLDPDWVRALEHEHRVAVRSVHTILRLRATSPERVRDDILASARLASALPRCATLVVHTPEVHSLHEPAAQEWFRAIGSAVETAASSHFRVAIENSGKMTRSAPTWALDHPHRLRWLAQEWDLSLTFDTAHAASRGWDVAEAVELLLPRVENVHLSDTSPGSFRFGMLNALLRDHQLPGRGELPLGTLLAHLRQLEYGGLVTLELSPTAIRAWWRPAVVRTLRETLDWCRAEAQRIPGKPPSRHRRQV
jgi:sugar phosphate isomerase/epimerase